jgi:hypothetical protein
MQQYFKVPDAEARKVAIGSLPVYHIELKKLLSK